MLTCNSKIIGESHLSEAVLMAVNALKRDIQNTLSDSDLEGFSISFNHVEDIQKECFVIRVKEIKEGAVDLKSLVISASDDLGFIYGIYFVSKNFLGVNEFWFWNEQEFHKKEAVEIPDDYYYESEPYEVRFRGWFVNDEVLIDDWKVDGDNEKPWEMAFEALLRCGGNMTIPGTDENAHIYNKLASKMGLWVTHHHAEPLGAKMFARAYPDLDASYDKYPELFEKLWREALISQENQKVIWNLGFRGQGDRPFWADDPAYDTDEKRGKLMSKLIRKQYDLVKEYDDKAICCTNLYGETMELYKKGLLDIPEDVIFIWADNGFGKMVSRRQGNHNPRIYALPEDNAGGRHGIYYHASFYDLQAAAQMTMLPNSPAFVVKEISDVYGKKADDFWIINCSNIKPHAYYLDLLARLWKKAPETNGFEAFADSFTDDYCNSYFEEKNAKEIAALYKKWASYCPSYGPNEDDHAGEQFTNHGARVLTTGFVTAFDKKDPANTKAADEWKWFSDKKTLKEQILDYRPIIEKALTGYKEYLDQSLELDNRIEGIDKDRFEDLFIWQVKYHYYSYLGALHTCDAILKCLVEKKPEFDNAAEREVIDCISQGQDKEGEPDYLGAFYEAGLAARAFKTGYEEMRKAEKGVFKGFFNNDCEADIKQSYYVLCGLMSFVRFHGDGPHFYKWQRMYQQGAGGNKVHLILRIRKHLTDQELFELML